MSARPHLICIPGHVHGGLAAAQGIASEVVKLPEARRGFVLLPRRLVVEWTFAWTARFRRLARDYMNASHRPLRACT